MNQSFQKFLRDISKIIPEERLITDDLRRLTYGTDASFYRLIPRLVVKVHNEQEVADIIRLAGEFRIPLTFRTAGTSLSGQSVTDSVLVVVDYCWDDILISGDASTISLSPAVIGARANLHLKKFGKKIGPDPASINAAMIGGIAANNASGMCCGTAQNSYNTLNGMRIVFADHSVLDTRDKDSVTSFHSSHKEFIQKISEISKRIKDNAELSERIRSKFKMKNTTGYSLNALVDFDDPIKIIEHLMIGSEGTLGFISNITYNTVPESPYKASSLLIFDDIYDACNAVAVLKGKNVDAVELMDRASLRSVENKPGMPEILKTLKEEAASLLVETSGEDESKLNRNIDDIRSSLDNFHLADGCNFTSVKEEYEKLWQIRKGLFPSVGAMRESGTTVIIEDVCFPVSRLAEATIDLQALFKKYSYNETIIFGHSLEGNLHFVFSQDFNTPSEIKRYEKFIDEISTLVVDKYDGSLKAEHGTGRNMAPFVELEWGETAYRLMKEIKEIFDPGNILNPGVLLNNDKNIHIKNLKPLPVADEIIDKCIECGFCENVCPSKAVTLTPRHRIVAWREISRLRAGDAPREQIDNMITLFDYYGNNTCATDGLCSISCPVDINTGILIKELRSDKLTDTDGRIASFISHQFKLTTAMLRFGLSAINIFHTIFGSKVFGSIMNFKRKITFNKIPKWNRYLPKANYHRFNDSLPGSGDKKVVYFPSCISRTMGVAKDFRGETQTMEMMDLLHKCNYQVIFPGNLEDLCCGMPFSSKGYVKQGDQKAEELLTELSAASEKGGIPVLFDTSPCTYRIREYLESNKSSFSSIKIYEAAEFIHDYILPTVDIKKSAEPVTLHITCSSRKMGLDRKLIEVAEACSQNVIIPEDVHCCGFAGDRGFTYPELNESALVNLKKQIPAECKNGYSNSKTCEIGLSNSSGINYQSIVYLVNKSIKKS